MIVCLDTPTLPKDPRTSRHLEVAGVKTFLFEDSFAGKEISSTSQHEGQQSYSKNALASFNRGTKRAVELACRRQLSDSKLTAPGHVAYKCNPHQSRVGGGFRSHTT